jgi:DNA-binding response OmpR family regulator
MVEKRILIVDDIAEDGMDRKNLLERYGYRAEVATSGSEALAKLISFDPTLILLDVYFKQRPKGDPYEDGYEVCRAIRQIPDYQRGKGKLILMISGELITDNDRRVGYGSGVDRYLVRPISPGLLLDEIEALWPPAVEPALQGTWIKVDENLLVHRYEPYVRIVCQQKEGNARLEDQRRLSKIVYNLLRYLMDKSPNICSRDELLKNVFKTEWGSNQQVDTAIHDLRSVIECNPRNRRYIKTVPKFGYKFER